MSARERLAGAALAVLSALMLAPAAQAAQVVIGETSLVPNTGSAQNLAPSNVPVFQGDASGNYVLSSPVNGTITQWSFLSTNVGDGSQFVLRVLRPADSTGASWTAVGTSGVVTVVGSSGLDSVQGPFPTSLPIQVGDRIGLEPVNGANTPIESGVNGQDGARWFTAPFSDSTTASIDPASNSDSGQVVPVQALVDSSPVNQQAPSISGSAIPGQIVSCSQGTWTNSPTSFAYHWLLDGAAIANQTSQTYAVGSGDAGHQLACRVTATNAGGSTSALSGSVTVAAPPKATLGSSVLHRSLVLNASGSSGGGSSIAGYQYRLSGQPSTAINCGPNSPVLVPQFTRPSSGIATLLVTAANGLTATSSISYSAPGVASLSQGGHLKRPAPPGVSRAPSRVIAYQCLPAAGSGGPDVPEAGGAQISSACEVDAGIVQVVGCGMQPVDDLCTGVPAAERQILEGHMAQQAGGNLKTLLTGPCGSVLRPRFLATLAAAGIRTKIPPYERLGDTFYVSTEPVRVNGLDIFPHAGSAIVLAVGGQALGAFAPFSAYLVSSNASVQLGGFPLPSSSRLDLNVSIAAARAQVASFQLKNPVTFNLLTRLALNQVLGGVPQLPIQGAFTATFVNGGVTDLGVNVSLQPLMANPFNDGVAFTGSTTLETTNHTGLRFDKLDINVPDIPIGVGDIKPLVLHYDRASDDYAGTFGLELTGSNAEVGGSLEFAHGLFVKGSEFYVADTGGGIPVGGPLYIVAINAGLSLYHPQVPGSQTAFDGAMTFSLGPAATDGCGLFDINGLVHIHFYPGPFLVTSEAQQRLFCYSMGSRYFSIDSDGHARIGEHFDVAMKDVGALHINVDGQAYVDTNNLAQSHLQLDGSGSATLDLGIFGSHTAGVQAVVSDLGMGLCADIDGFHPGIGESFRPPPVNQIAFLANLSLMGDHCDISPYQPLGKGGPPSAADAPGRRLPAAAAQAAYSFSVPASEQTAVVTLKGAGGAPAVTLTGPGGRTINTASDWLSPTQLVLRQPSTGTTLVEIRGTKTGRWTFTPDPGSVPIVAAFTAHELPAPSISAFVSGHGAHRVLHYRVVQQPGMQVSFIEQGRNGGEPIGVARRARGAIAFTPSDAAPGTRTILATIARGGMPLPAVVVAHYVGAPVRAGRPRALTAKRLGGGLLVTFGAAPFAQSYIVAIRLGDGRNLVLAVRAGRRSLLVRGVGARVRVLSVAVTGLRHGVPGPTLFARRLPR